jgi:sentrin-specific protease 1
MSLIFLLTLCNRPRPPPSFQPTLDQMKISQRRKDNDVEKRIQGVKITPPAQLPPDKDAQVDILLKKRGVIAKFAREQISDQDLCRLQPKQWLNDEIINFYGAMILARSENRKETCPKKAPGLLNIHYFSTFFWTKLKEGYEKGRLAKWTKKVSI